MSFRLALIRFLNANSCTFKTQHMKIQINKNNLKKKEVRYIYLDYISRVAIRVTLLLIYLFMNMEWNKKYKYVPIQYHPQYNPKNQTKIEINFNDNDKEKLGEEGTIPTNPLLE